MGYGDMIGGAAGMAGTGAALGSMAGPIGTGIGAAVGGIGGLVGGIMGGDERRKERNRQIELAAATQELSPWTNLRAQMPGQAPSQYGLMEQGLGTGISMYQKGQQFQSDLLEQRAKTDYLASRTGANNMMSKVPVAQSVREVSNADVAVNLPNEVSLGEYEKLLANNQGRNIPTPNIM